MLSLTIHQVTCEQNIPYPKDSLVLWSQKHQVGSLLSIDHGISGQERSVVLMGSKCISANTMTECSRLVSTVSDSKLCEIVEAIAQNLLSIKESEDEATGKINPSIFSRRVSHV